MFDQVFPIRGSLKSYQYHHVFPPALQAQRQLAEREARAEAFFLQRKLVRWRLALLLEALPPDARGPSRPARPRSWVVFKLPPKLE